jgi:hypothetical protein
VAARLGEKARDRIADYALDVARQYEERSDPTAALANLRAAATGRPSPRTLRRLGEMLRGEHREATG